MSRVPRLPALWIAGGLMFVAFYGLAWAATARVGVPAVAALLRAERPRLLDIEVRSPGPFVVRAGFECAQRRDGLLVGHAWRQYLWLPGSLREVARDGPFLSTDD